MNRDDAAESAWRTYEHLLTKGTGTALKVETPNDEGLLTLMRVMTDGILQYVRTSAKLTQLESSLLQPDRVSVTTFDQASVQAATLWVDPCHVIGVNRGLMLFVYRMSRILAPYKLIRGSKDE